MSLNNTMDESVMRAMLSDFGRETLNGILNFIPVKEPRQYLYDLIEDYPRRGGKGFRPGLCMATCGAYGGKLREAKFSAICLELLHNAFLIHDDVEDDSFYRRNKPTMHQANSKAIAINVGDAMNALSLHPLIRNRDILGDRVAELIFLEIQHLVTESSEGQAMELGWRKDNRCDLSPEDYLRLILKKTCWYTCIHPIRIGAIIGTKGTVDPDQFNRLGYFMGASFQIQDDILNLVGDEGKYGKEIGGDILEGKRTLMLIHLFSLCHRTEFGFIEEFLATPITGRSVSDAQRVFGYMLKYGSVEYAKETSKYLAGAALKEFYSIFSRLPDSRDKAFLESLILYMINRSY